MEESGNVNIKNLKISKIGWTSIYAHNKNGDVHCILVKKNLFKGYTMIDSNGNKIKIDDLNKYNELVVISHSKKMFVSKESVISENTALEVKNQMYKEAIDDIHKKQHELVRAQTENENQMVAHAETIKDIERKRKTEIFRKISYLSASLENVTKGIWTEEGTDISYEKPNALQISIGRTIGNVIRKPYKKTAHFNVNMESYLEILEGKIGEKYKSEVSNLRSLLSQLSSRINGLKKDYTDTLYVQTVALETIFTTRLSDLIITCWPQYKNQDIYYYSRGKRWGQNDEEIIETSSIDSLIHSGKEACANLIEKIMGSEDKMKFLSTIDLLSDTYSSDEEVQSKTM